MQKETYVYLKDLISFLKQNSPAEDRNSNRKKEIIPIHTVNKNPIFLKVHFLSHKTSSCHLNKD